MSQNTNPILKGSTSTGVTFTASNAKLHTLNATWNPNNKYAFEASLQVTSPYTVYANLYDITAGAAVSGSQISTTSTTFTVVRSGQFTLIPGHQYGISLWSNSGSGTMVYLTDASLIVFPS
jgi:Flp pilus assembly protein TadG